MKGIKTLFIIAALFTLGGCGIFKEDCNCPTFGKDDPTMPGQELERESVTASSENS